MEQYQYRKERITVDLGGQTIWGIACIPETGTEKVPLVICAHHLGGNYTSCMGYAERIASIGMAAYCFDFRGGGGRHSDGLMTDMSLLTEAEDVLAVLAAAKTWDFADPERIILFGESQGGAASAIAAARSAENVKGLILCYPALIVPDSMHDLFDSLEEVPESFFFNWLTLGKAYAADVWDYDIYAEIGAFQKPVLLLHGDRDKLVPVSYAERAAEVYPDAEYHVIEGAGHIFYGSAFDRACDYILQYLRKM